MAKTKLFTIGHSNRSFEEFLKILKKFEIEVLADVRRFPSSKFNHFKKEFLEKILPENGIEYIWIEKLGGYRKRIFEHSPNKAIENEGFRNYADYMLTKDFQEEIRILEEIARKKRACIMCAEKLYWKCHRLLLSDYLAIVTDFEVIHILDAENTRKHSPSRHARRTEKGLIYDFQDF